MAWPPEPSAPPLQTAHQQGISPNFLFRPQPPTQIRSIPPLPSPTKHRHHPIIIITISIILCIVFVATIAVDNCPHYRPPRPCFLRPLGRFSFQPLSVNPLLGPTSSTLRTMGAIDTRTSLHHNFRWQSWRLLTCTWLHGGLLHLLGNLLGLVVIGNRLERDCGPLRIGVLYLLAGFGGALCSQLFLLNRISVGASGAIFGLLGAMIADLLMNWDMYENKWSGLGTMLAILVLNLGFGLMPNVDNFAHLGGLVTGFLLGFVLLMKPQWKWQSVRYLTLELSSPGRQEREAKKHSQVQRVLWWVSLCIVTVLYAAGLIAFFSGVEIAEKCSWCSYLSCIPTSFWSCKDSGGSPIVCQIETYKNGTGILTCPNGQRSFHHDLGSASRTALQTLCSESCS